MCGADLRGPSRRRRHGHCKPAGTGLRSRMRPKDASGGANLNGRLGKMPRCGGCPCRRQPPRHCHTCQPHTTRELPAGIAGGITADGGRHGGDMCFVPHRRGRRERRQRVGGAGRQQSRRRMAQAARDNSSPRTTPDPSSSACTGCKSSASAATQRPGGQRTFFNPSIKAAPWQRQGQAVRGRRGAAQGSPSRRRKETVVRMRPSQLPAGRERPRGRRHRARRPPSRPAGQGRLESRRAQKCRPSRPAGQGRPKTRRQGMPAGQGPAGRESPR